MAAEDFVLSQMCGQKSAEEQNRLQNASGIRLGGLRLRHAFLSGGISTVSLGEWVLHG